MRSVPRLYNESVMGSFWGREPLFSTWNGRWLLHVGYVHLTKAKHIHKRGCYTRAMSVRVELQKKISAHEPQEARRQDELIGSKPPVVKWL
jgi:hypothetical protein